MRVQVVGGGFGWVGMGQLGMDRWNESKSKTKKKRRERKKRN